MKQENEDVTFLGTVTFNQLPIPGSGKLTNTTTPDVTNLIAIIGSGVVVTITDFVGGKDSQTIRIRGDGTTTVQNGTRIITNTGADKLLVLNRVYKFTYYLSDMKWCEDI